MTEYKLTTRDLRMLVEGYVAEAKIFRDTARTTRNEALRANFRNHAKEAITAARHWQDTRNAVCGRRLARDVADQIEAQSPYFEAA